MPSKTSLILRACEEIVLGFGTNKIFASSSRRRPGPTLGRFGLFKQWQYFIGHEWFVRRTDGPRPAPG
jgi:hypothetical protein